MDPERPSDVEQRKALVVARGLPCVVRLRRNGAFSCLDLHPAPGWTHLVSYPNAEAFGAYPVGGIEVVERGEDTVEVVATLVATAVAGAELDAVVVGLARMPGIEHATWSVQTAD